MTNYTIINNEEINKYASYKSFNLYTVLKSMCYADKISCYPSQKYLARILRCSVRTIQRYIAELRQLKLITIKRTKLTNVYTLINKKLENLDIFKQKKETRNNVIKKLVKEKYDNDVAVDPKNDDVAVENSKKNTTVLTNSSKYSKFKNYKNKKSCDNSTFCDYNQRNYDYDKLENALLNNKETNFEDLLL